MLPASLGKTALMWFDVPSRLVCKLRAVQQWAPLLSCVRFFSIMGSRGSGVAVCHPWWDHLTISSAVVVLICYNRSIELLEFRTMGGVGLQHGLILLVNVISLSVAVLEFWYSGTGAPQLNLISGSTHECQVVSLPDHGAVTASCWCTDHHTNCLQNCNPAKFGNEKYELGT